MNKANINYIIYENRLKYLIFLSIFVLSILFCFSCHNNRLKTNEKELVKKINIQEKEKAEAENISNEKQEVDTLYRLPKGFRYKENRTVDPAHPPVCIDFSKEIPIRELKLSNITSKVKYIVLQVPGDSTSFSPKGILNFTPNNIISSNVYGIRSFTRDGRFIETICKNTFDGIKVIKFDNTFKFNLIENFIGAETYVKTVGNTIFYKYLNNPAGKSILLRYSLEANPQLSIASQPLESGQPDTYKKGDEISTVKDVLGIPIPKLVTVSESCYAEAVPDLTTLKRNSLLLVTYNLQGDTLCKFKQYDFLEIPITRSVNWGVPHLQWYFGQKSAFKWAFNDTIFRLISANRLLPVFVFNFGKYKVTDDEWFQYEVTMNEKRIPNEILEDLRYLYIYFEYFPTNSKAKSIKEYALFDKTTNDLFRLKFDNEKKNKRLDPLESMRKGFWKAGFENDIDGGPPFWPEYVTPEGNLVMSFQPEQLKEFIQRADYMSGNDPNKRAFKAFVQSLKTGGREIVIMITE